MFELKKYRGVVFHETEEGYKISRVIDLFKIDIRNLTNFDLAVKSLKNFHFNGLLLRKVYIL